MYLFSRRAQLAPGNTAAAMTWATNITEKVNQITDLTLSLFTEIYSPGVGVLSWSAFVPDLATLEAATDKLAVDESYISMVDAGAKFAAGAATDLLSQIVHGAPDPNRKVEYVSVVQSACASGALTKGIELGVEIAQRAEKITGVPTMFATRATGTYGGVAWISGNADIKALEAAQAALAADAKFGEHVDKSVKGVYVEDLEATRTTIFRRIV